MLSLSHLESRTWQLNPMFVRCLRQELHSKGFVTAYLLLLLIGTVASLWFAAIASDAIAQGSSDAGKHGRWLFNTLAVVWGFVLVVWQAGATNRAVLLERQDDTWDLVELTGLGPRRIVRGLLMTSIVQGVLYTAGLAPFLAMAYLLRGLDLLAVMEAFLLVPMAGAVASAWAVLGAAAAPPKARKAAGGVGGLVVLLVLVVPWLALSGSLFSSIGERSLLAVLWSKGREGAALGALILHGWALALWLPLVLAETLLSHRAEDRSSRPRLAAVVVAGSIILWAGIGACFASRWEQPLQVGAVLLTLLTVLTLFFAGTEDASLTVRQARSLDSWPSVLRGLFAPGDRRGLRLAGVLAMAAMGLAVIALSSSASGVEETLFGAWFTIVYAMILFLAGDALLRGPLARWCTTPGSRRFGLLLWTALWTLLPLIGLVIGSPRLAEGAQLLSPPVAVARLAGDSDFALHRLTVSLIGALVLVLFIIRLLPRAYATRLVVADATTANPRS